MKNNEIFLEDKQGFRGDIKRHGFTRIIRISTDCLGGGSDICCTTYIL